MRPIVSCSVPVHNGERFLGETIESILSQDYRPLEIIVVDDGSQDSSVEVADSFQPDVRLVQQMEAGPSLRQVSICGVSMNNRDSKYEAADGG